MTNSLNDSTREGINLPPAFTTSSQGETRAGEWHSGYVVVLALFVFYPRSHAE